MNLIKNNYIILLFFISQFCFIPQLSAQNKNGVAGYGKMEIILVASEIGDLYFGGGGGVIVNNNLMFGSYLRAMYQPYKYNFFSESDTDTLGQQFNPLSKTENAVSTIINNIEMGFSLGVNIGPEKPVQGTIQLMMGYNSISFNEIIYYENPDNIDDFSFLDVRLGYGGFNASIQGELQLKVGQSFKIGLPIGYHYATVFNSYVFKNPRLFSGFYAGLDLTFGSF